MKLIKESYTLELTREEMEELRTALEVWNRDLSLPDPVTGKVEEPERVEMTASLFRFITNCIC